MIDYILLLMGFFVMVIGAATGGFTSNFTRAKVGVLFMVIGLIILWVGLILAVIVRYDLPCA